MPEHKLVATLRALRENDVQFIVVGGPAAALNGVPINTFDLDAVHSRDPENIARLVPALESLDAVFRVGLIG
jgi:hypothetical protein